jgi:protein phosphatase
MGGHNAGEVASRVALEATVDFLRYSAGDEDCTWPFGFDPNLSVVQNRLVNAAKVANRRVFRLAEQRADYAGMGTTLVAALISRARLTYLSVGDSRLYSHNGSGLIQLTEDDSWLAKLSQDGITDMAALSRHPMRHALTSVVGGHADIEISTKELDLTEGQTILLCTDGIHGTLTSEQMQAILEREPELDRAAGSLVQTALDLKGRDNMTVLLARYASASDGRTGV